MKTPKSATVGERKGEGNGSGGDSVGHKYEVAHDEDEKVVFCLLVGG